MSVTRGVDFFSFLRRFTEIAAERVHVDNGIAGTLSGNDYSWTNAKSYDISIATSRARGERKVTRVKRGVSVI